MHEPFSGSCIEYSGNGHTREAELLYLFADRRILRFPINMHDRNNTSHRDISSIGTTEVMFSKRDTLGDGIPAGIRTTVFVINFEHELLELLLFVFKICCDKFLLSFI